MSQLSYTSYAITAKDESQKINLHNFYLNGKVIQNNDKDIATTTGNCKKSSLFAICEGVGDLEYAKSSSDSCISIFSNLSSQIKDNTSLADIIKSTNTNCDALNEILSDNFQKTNIKTGATLTSLLFCSDEAISMNIGDNRTYLLRNDNLKQLSKDHLKIEYYENEPTTKTLTCFIGSNKNCMPNWAEKFSLQEKDKFLICSHELKDYMESIDLLNILTQYKPIDEIANELMLKFHKKSNLDNLTLILIEIHKS